MIEMKMTIRKWLIFAVLTVVAISVLVVLVALGWFLSLSPPMFRDGYIRISRDDAGVFHSQTASQRFINRSTGDHVTLVGVCHVGNQAYYRQLLDDLTAFDKVIFEGVAPTGSADDAANRGNNDEPSSKPLEVDSLSNAYIDLGEATGLVYQGEQISSRYENWIWCDVTTSQLEEEARRLGVDPEAMLEPSGGTSIGNSILKSENAFQLLKDLPVPLSIKLALFKRHLRTGDLRRSKRAVIALNLKMDDASDLEIQKARHFFETVILRFRNENVFKQVHLFLLNPEMQNVAVLYGAAHMEGIASMLLDQGFEREGEMKWRDVFDY